jgi:hypothetical protein
MTGKADSVIVLQDPEAEDATMELEEDVDGELGAASIGSSSEGAADTTDVTTGIRGTYSVTVTDVLASCGLCGRVSVRPVPTLLFFDVTVAFGAEEDRLIAESDLAVEYCTSDSEDEMLEDADDDVSDTIEGLAIHTEGWPEI